MNKLAQRRSTRSKIWESVNLTGKALEGLHSEFGEVMEEMRNVDEGIRNIADDVKPLVRQAKSLFRQRDYLNAAFALSEFHRRVRHVAHILSKFSANVNIKHYKFLLDQFEPSNREKLFGYDPNAEIKQACYQFDSLVKEAGPYDWMKEKFVDAYDFIGDTGSNIMTDKGRARKQLEKRFSSGFIKELKTETTKLLEYSIKMLNNLLSTFDMLETGISRRNIGLYVDKAKDFVKKFDEYHKIYVNYDTKILQQLKVYQAEQDKKDQIEKDKLEQIRQENVKKQEEKELQEIEEARKSPLVTPFVEPEKTEEEIVYKEPTFEEWKKIKEESEKTLKKLDDKEANFINRISIFAEQEDINSFIKELISYSKYTDDSNISKDLVVLANDMIHEYKVAGIFDIFKSKQPAEKQQESKQPPVEDIKKKDKPRELIDEEENLYTQKTIDLPEGRIDKAYTDIPFLSQITPNKIRVTPEAARLIITNFIRRLAAVKDIDNIKPYINAIEAKLIPILKQAVYDGWVISSDNVFDSHNPKDKYIEVYTRLNLSNIDTSLSGIAKLYINCRLSANHGVTTIRGIKKYFTIDDVKTKTPITESFDEDENSNDNWNEKYDTE